MPYVAARSLLSPAEHEFFEALVSVVAGACAIFVKVRLIDLLELPPGTVNRQGWLNRVVSKHVDFVLCDPHSLRPLLVIELDDRSHARADRIERDGFLDSVMDCAGIPVEHVRCAGAYDLSALAARVRPYVLPARPIATS
jgi:hypothetical protein